MPDSVSQIDFNTTVDEVMRRRPATIRVFLGFKMACVGCPIASFHTVLDACREHGIDAALFVAALEQSPAIRGSRPPSLTESPQRARTAGADRARQCAGGRSRSVPAVPRR